PSIDYVVTKIPRFTFEKFPAANDRLTTQMKSVGEVMAIGRTFQESLQKALRGLETGLEGLTPQLSMPLSDESADRLAHELRAPGAPPRHAGEGDPRQASRAEDPAGVQARRHLRGRVLDLDRVSLLDLRGGVRGEPEQRPQDHDPRRRAQPHRAGDRVRLLLRA